MLADRISQALGVLGSDETVSGPLRNQIEAYLGEDVDARTLAYIKETAQAAYAHTYSKAKAAGYKDATAHGASITNVLVVGMALGKRLGIQDGERFAREVPSVD